MNTFDELQSHLYFLFIIELSEHSLHISTSRTQHLLTIPLIPYSLYTNMLFSLLQLWRRLVHFYWPSSSDSSPGEYTLLSAIDTTVTRTASACPRLLHGVYLTTGRKYEGGLRATRLHRTTVARSYENLRCSKTGFCARQLGHGGAATCCELLN